MNAKDSSSEEIDKITNIFDERLPPPPLQVILADVNHIAAAASIGRYLLVAGRVIVADSPSPCVSGILGTAK